MRAELTKPATGILPARGLRRLWNGAKVVGLALLPDALILIIRYVWHQRRAPNVFRPSAFTEKVLCKMLYDRNPLLPVIADKLAVRDFVRDRVGEDILNPLHAVYERAEEIDLDMLPDRFVLKANHGSNFNYFVRSADDKDRDIIVPLGRHWLAKNYGRRLQEWVYKPIPPRLFADSFLETGDQSLLDYKFFCFDGEPRFLKVIGDQVTQPASRYFDLDWKIFDVMEYQREALPDTHPRPENFGRMLDVARRLSHGFDFIRVDLHNIGGRIVFSELTNYHNAGRQRFRPRSYDFTFGAYWNRESMTYLPRWPWR